MNKTLILKELHDLRYVLAIAGLAIFILVTSLFGFTPTGRIMYLLGHETRILKDIFRDTDMEAQPPFSPFGYIRPVSQATCALALILGFTQGFHENRSGRWQFLLSLPVTRIQILHSKILVGLGIWLTTVLILVGAGVFYSAIPGRVPYPLTGWLVWGACQWLPLGAVLYMSALYCGFRRVHWLGTRLFPVIGSLLVILGSCTIASKIYPHFTNDTFYLKNPSLSIGQFFISIFSVFLIVIFYFQIKTQPIES